MTLAVKMTLNPNTTNQSAGCKDVCFMYILLFSECEYRLSATVRECPLKQQRRKHHPSNLKRFFFSHN